ncbi:MAG: hypothetical protein QOH24_876 [Verrucomicrobiota bacterium]|jgi:hypothetical protein
MKKLLMIALVALGCLIATAPESNAGVSIGIGFGFPGYFGYPAYYGYYPYAYPVSYYAPVYYSFGYRPYYWWHGRRIYRHHYWR